MNPILDHIETNTPLKQGLQWHRSGYDTLTDNHNILIIRAYTIPMTVCVIELYEDHILIKTQDCWGEQQIEEKIPLSDPNLIQKTQQTIKTI